MNQKYLEIHQLGKSFDGPLGPNKVVEGFDLTLREGEFVSIIGHSGCGKSTVLSMVAGLTESTEGAIILAGKEVVEAGPDRGVVFQAPCLLTWLTALENVLAGRLFGGPGSRLDEESRAVSLAVLDRVGLSEKADVEADAFTIVERKWLEVGRALAAHPQLLLLDEFMAGLTSREIPHAIDLLKSIRDSGVTIVLVEHVVKAITGACDRVVVLDAGKKLAEGSPDAIVRDPAVIEAYLGTGHAAG